MNNYIKRLIIRMLLLLFVVFFSKDLIYPIIEFFTVKLSYLFLLPLKPVISHYTTFVIKEHIIEIAPPCIAFSAYVLLAILVLTTKDTPLKESLKVFLYGSLLILIINVIRIDLLVYALILISSRLFETIHLFFWKVLSGIVVVLIWIYLIRKYNIKEIPIYSDVKYLMRKIKLRSK